LDNPFHISSLNFDGRETTLADETAVKIASTLPRAAHQDHFDAAMHGALPLPYARATSYCNLKNLLAKVKWN
jgi:hypothetical protein